MHDQVTWQARLSAKYAANGTDQYECDILSITVTTATLVFTNLISTRLAAVRRATGHDPGRGLGQQHIDFEHADPAWTTPAQLATYSQ